jgi:hypothetical protein
MEVNEAKQMLDQHYPYAGGKGYSTGWNIAKTFLDGHSITQVWRLYETNVSQHQIEQLVRARAVMYREGLA